MTESAESDIASLPGVGEKMVLLLKEHGFSSIKSIAEAKEDDLSKIPKIGEKTAKRSLMLRGG